MSRRPLLAALSALLLFASPPAVFAQSAGDDQYEDPFAGEAPPGGSPDEQGELTEDPPGLGETPPTSTGGGGEQDVAAEQGESASADDRTALPATGSETTLIAMLGSGLVLAGAGMRLSLRADGRRAV